jgi:hypothetical protein
LSEQADTAIEEALERLARLLSGGGSSSGLGGPSEPTTSPATGSTVPVTSPTTPVGGPAGSQTVDGAATGMEQAEVARHVLYMMSVPVLTTARIAELEQSLPKLVAFLHSLRHRPTMLGDIHRIMQSLSKGGGASERSESTLSSAEQLARIMQGDLSENGERVAPLALGLFMAAYTIVHNWN